MYVFAGANQEVFSHTSTHMPLFDYVDLYLNFDTII